MVANHTGPVVAAHRVLDQMEGSGLIPPETYRGKRVLDWECGRGHYSIAFAQRGATAVLGADSWVDAGAISDMRDDRVSFRKVSVAQLTEEGGDPFELVFANTVTEHLPNLHHQIQLCANVMARGGSLVLNHDNYYHPVGSHDHGFLGSTDGGIGALGPRCWDSPERCATSAGFRNEVRRRYPWTWDDQMESGLTPEDCSRCTYFRRSQPWGHLLYQDAFPEVFPQRCFSTGHENSGLNKVFPQQLRQALVEAGLRVTFWGTTKVTNVPPAELLSSPYFYSEEVLTTWMVQVRAVKD